jgi:nitric oxide reductase NorE protein
MPDGRTQVVAISRPVALADAERISAFRKSKLPGVDGIWVFITGDLVMFMIYFLVFTTGRMEAPAAYDLGRRQLDPLIGCALTLILLTSSWLVVRAVEAAREGSSGRVRTNLLLAMLLGTGFAGLKAFGYVHDALAGHSPSSNPFFGYYYAITGIHCMHVMLGMGLLLICYVKASKPIDDKYVLWIESGACFWHMVDMLWVLLFPMFYLLRSGVL